MGLALVVVEEDARRAVHLRDDDALGAVDDEGAVVGHQRHFAHVDFLLLDVLDRLRAGLLVDIEHDQAERHLERRGIGHAALAALVDVVFGRIEVVADELEKRGIGEVGDREDRLEHRLQAFVGPPALRLVHEQELVVGRLLNLDEVRHLGDFPDGAEEPADPSPTGECLGHVHSSCHFLNCCPEDRRPVACGAVLWTTVPGALDFVGGWRRFDRRRHSVLRFRPAYREAWISRAMSRAFAPGPTQIGILYFSSTLAPAPRAGP